MMIPIKIQCGCGQRHAFEAETGVYLMPNAVACPVCGADGAAAANVIIARSLSAQSTVAATPVDEPRVRVATPLPPVPGAARLRAAPPPALKINHTQAQHEAKAKIFWGDPPEEVIKYLKVQGFSYEEASGLVQAMFQERAVTIRANGIRKIVIGTGLVAVPLVTFFIFLSIGIIFMKLLALTIIVGLWGVWMLVNGIFMILAPKWERGDVADQ